jgi:transcriptional regulator GlxA family with amidase domain
MNKINVAILIFNEVEVLDFSGPYEVFSRTRTIKGSDSRRNTDSAPFNPFTIAMDKNLIVATGGLKVIPDYSLDNSPKIDILVIPGGYGTRPLLNNEDLLNWIIKISKEVNIVSSICTGALLLAKAGLLDGKRATTHWGAIEALKSISNSINVITNKRIVDDGIITSAGVSSGIDMSFEIVSKLFGEEVASDTAKYIEFHRSKTTV